MSCVCIYILTLSLIIQSTESYKLEDKVYNLLSLFRQDDVSVCTAVIYGIDSRFNFNSQNFVI